MIFMNDNQKSFLNELSALCGRYGVDVIDIKDDRIRVVSNGEELCFKEYNNIEITFFGIATTKKCYEVTLDTCIEKR